MDGMAAVARNAGRNAGAGRAADSARAAGRRNLDATIVDAMCRIEVEKGPWAGDGR